ncbi:cysteine desulfurase [Undibacterium amnicola]|uniref:cysteine desulfurase n=1 Tax=Undibacterium amnicola TaxID=1834038 RepID=A0ABR6XTA8_9BURK|nr:family 2A encapsulin nanocompartment cargo protein cysteine desulfurase [Undibacterium amnicola]MBC3832708.1 cysteine desulfurase [Undibacterium amnicola]
MTILTPTSNRSDHQTGDIGGSPIDEATLNRLAGEFFANIPGAAQMASHFIGGSAASSSPTTPRSHAASVPLIEPQLAQSGTPASVTTAAIAQGVPVDFAAALPHHGLAAHPSEQAYYFLSADNQYGSSDHQLDTLAGLATGKADQSVVAQSFGLPGQLHLQGQPRSRDESSTLAQTAYTPTLVSLKQNPASSFYFEQANQFYWDQAPAIRLQHSGVQAPFDINAVRSDFPILAERVNGKPLVWFDNAATTQKPQSVIDRISYFYEHENSNIHRAAHELAARATDAYEAARQKVANFLGAASTNEIIFVRGATEAINLVAQTFGKKFIGAGDEIIVSHLEHHANIVPWQQLAAEKGAVIRVIPVDDSGQILLDEYRKLLNHRTKLVAVTQVSNALGTVTPVQEIIAIAHRAGAKVLIDGAQAVSHLAVNVQALDADFYVFSGHKVFGPTGIGVVYGKQALLDQLPPWQGGGNMIVDVTFERTQYHAAPARFEAGTGNIADAVGLGAAIDYVQKLGLEKIALYEHALLEYATQGLKTIPGVRLIGTAHEKASVASFVLAGYSTEEVGKALNEEGIAVRSGHHCAQPILRRFGVEATVRPSFAFYNTCEEIDRLIAVVRRLANARK